MAQVNFIRFFPSLDEALSIRTSPEIQFYCANGVNILPSDLIKIRQLTDHFSGVSVEDWSAYVVDLRTGVETDITDKFAVEEVFSDENGKPQIMWSVSNLQNFGNRLVYFKIQQAIGQDFYSNLFTINNELEKHVHVHYKNSISDKMLSIGLLSWFVEELKETELKNYYETSTKATVTLTIKSQKFERWVTDIINRDLAIKISDLFENKFVYIDNVRANLFEAMEIPEVESMSITKRYKLKISFSKNDVFDPFALEEIVQVIPTINLISVSTNGSIAIFDFNFSNFAPAFFTFEYSQDQVSWTSENKGITSTQSVAFSRVGTWFFRVRHPLAISNVIELVVDANLIANNDNATALKGGFVDINVLFNDFLTGNVSITSLTTPTNGSVSVNADKTIRYSHNGTNTTFDSFSYTISNGVTSDSANVGVVIMAVSGSSTSLLMANTGNLDAITACSLVLNKTRYHNGLTSIPTLNDFVFSDIALTTVFNGQNKFYSVPNGRVIQIDENGRVINIATCGSGGINPI